MTRQKITPLHDQMESAARWLATLIEVARHRAKNYHAFDPPVLAKYIEKLADEVDRLQEKLNIALTEQMDAFADTDRLRIALKEFLSTHGCKCPKECSECAAAHKEASK